MSWGTPGETFTTQEKHTFISYPDAKVTKFRYRKDQDFEIARIEGMKLEIDRFSVYPVFHGPFRQFQREHISKCIFEGARFESVPSLCCSEAIHVKCISPPCCSDGTFYFFDPVEWPVAHIKTPCMEMQDSNIMYIQACENCVDDLNGRNEETKKARLQLARELHWNIGTYRTHEDRDLARITNALLGQAVGSILIGYLGERVSATLMSGLWGSVCSFHGDYLEYALSVKYTDRQFKRFPKYGRKLADVHEYEYGGVTWRGRWDPPKIQYIRPAFRRALTSYSLTNWIFKHQQNVKAALGLATTFFREKERVLETIDDTYKGMVKNVGWGGKGLWSTLAVAQEHHVNHDEYFLAWKFIYDLLTDTKSLLHSLMQNQDAWIPCEIKNSSLTAKYRKSVIVCIALDEILSRSETGWDPVLDSSGLTMCGVRCEEFKSIPFYTHGLKCLLKDRILNVLRNTLVVFLCRDCKAHEKKFRTMIDFFERHTPIGTHSDQNALHERQMSLEAQQEAFIRAEREREMAESEFVYGNDDDEIVQERDADIKEARQEALIRGEQEQDEDAGEVLAQDPDYVDPAEEDRRSDTEDEEPRSHFIHRMDDI